jgi:hypothetical protein
VLQPGGYKTLAAIFLKDLLDISLIRLRGRGRKGKRDAT